MATSRLGLAAATTSSWLARSRVLATGRSVSTASQEAHEAEVTPATVAQWRRRQEASLVDPSRSNDCQDHTKESQHTPPSAPITPADTTAHSFAESQQAGLAALRLTSAAAGRAEASVTTDPALPSRSSALPVDTAPDLATTGAVSVATQPTQVTDHAQAGASSAITTPDDLLTTVREAPKAGWTGLSRVPWPLAVILVIQACMALRLVWSNTAFIDEATYVYTGSQELRHWFLGAPVQDYQTFLSGSPALYPPIGAIANAIGGLAAARVLSLLFMLGTSSLLYATTNCLFGKAAAVLGAAIFAALGVTQFLSASATYDSMALFLVALTTYFIIGRRDDGSLTAACLSGVVAPFVLALANATDYSTALWDPVIIGLAICAAVLGGNTWRYGARRAGQFGAVLVAFLIIGLAMGNAKYVHGILFSTIDRSQSMGQSAELMLHKIWIWAGAVFVLAVVGSISLTIPKLRSVSVVGVLLLIASFAVPVEEALTGTSATLQKHVVFGAWFGCILAGVALTRLFRYKVLIGALGVLLIGGLPAVYAGQAASLYHSWPTENPVFIRELKALVRPGHTHYLIEGSLNIPAYYVGSDVSSLQWNDIGTFSDPNPASEAQNLNTSSLVKAIIRKEFTLIILNSSRKSNAALSVVADMKKYGGYHIAAYLAPATIGSRVGYTVWRVDAPSVPRQIA